MKPPAALESRRTRAVIVLLLIIVGGALWWTLNRSTDDTAVVTGSGTIEADEIALGTEIGGRVASLSVDEGAEVAAGAVLATLDTSVLDAQVQQAQAAVDVARANLAIVQQGARPEDVQQADGAVAQAVAVRDAAKRALDNAQASRDDPQDLNLRIETARAQLDGARAALDKLTRGATNQDIATAQADVNSATANLTTAQARLDQLVNGPTVEQIAEAEASARAARNQLYATQSQADAYLGNPAVTRGAIIFTDDMKNAQAGVAYEQAQAAEARLAQLKDPPRPESVKQAQGARDQSQAALDAANARLDKLKAGATDEDIRLAQANAQQAQASLDGLLAMRDKPLALNSQVDAAQGQLQAAEGALQSAQSRLDALKNGATDQQLEASKAQVRQSEASLGVLSAQHDKATLRAPIAGIITKRNVSVGETVAPLARLLTLANLDSVTITVYVPETRIGRVSLGQKADVTVDSFPDRSFQGQVTFISARAEFTPRNVQSQKERAGTVFGVKVRLDNAEHLLKPGMPADAKIGG